MAHAIVMEILVDRIPTMSKIEKALFGSQILEHASTHIAKSDWDIEVQGLAVMLCVRLACQHMPANLLPNSLMDALKKSSKVINEFCK